MDTKYISFSQMQLELFTVKQKSYSKLRMIGKGGTSTVRN